MSVEGNTSFRYSIGLSGLCYLSLNKNVYIHSEVLDNDIIREIECDNESKCMKVRERNENSIEWVELELNELHKGIILDLNDNGYRWEGACLNGYPFGYGSIYNEHNVIIYNGFVYEGMKVCYGIKYYGDNGIVEYCGTYYKNTRFGKGRLYDKKNELVYEGEWYDNNPLELVSIHLKDKEVLTDSSIHFGLEELIIDSFCKTSLSTIQLIGFPHLKQLQIGNFGHCYIYFNTMKVFIKDMKKAMDVENNELILIENCNELTEVNVGISLLFNDNDNICGKFSIRNCQKLHKVKFGQLSVTDHFSCLEMKSDIRCID